MKWLNSFFIIVVCFQSQAQSTIFNNHNSPFEVFVGPSLVGVTNNSLYEEYGVPKVEFAIGIGIARKISERFDFSLRAFFDRKGFLQKAEAFYPPDIYNNPPTSNLPPVSTQLSGNLANDYLTVSIMPRYYIGNGKKYFFGFGVYGSILLKSQIVVTQSQFGVVKYKSTLDVYSTYKENDFGFSITGGYLFQISDKVNIAPQIQWNYGLMNIVYLQPGLLPMNNNSIVMIICLSYSRS